MILHLTQDKLDWQEINHHEEQVLDKRTEIINAIRSGACFCPELSVGIDFSNVSNSFR